jgi:hypothetical protein
MQHKGNQAKEGGIQRKWGNARSFLAIFIEPLFFSFFLLQRISRREGSTWWLGEKLAGADSGCLFFFSPYLTRQHSRLVAF